MACCSYMHEHMNATRPSNALAGDDVRVLRRYMRGYKNVINKGIELNESGEACELMMETSGHGALKQNYYLDDGAYLSVKIIIEAARRRWQGKPGIRRVSRCRFLHAPALA
jgi:hypothetical protein